MSKILVASNGFFTDTIKKQFLELIDGERIDVRTAIITTVSELKENNRFAVKIKRRFYANGIYGC